MKINIIYFFSIIIMEVGLLLQWFTLRRITMLILFFILVILTTELVVLLNSWIIYIISFINGIFIYAFIEWNFKEDVYDY